jgi:hypothetical protein
MRGNRGGIDTAGVFFGRLEFLRRVQTAEKSNGSELVPVHLRGRGSNASGAGA